MKSTLLPIHCKGVLAQAHETHSSQWKLGRAHPGITALWLLVPHKIRLSTCALQFSASFTVLSTKWKLESGMSAMGFCNYALLDWSFPFSENETSSRPRKVEQAARPSQKQSGRGVVWERD